MNDAPERIWANKVFWPNVTKTDDCWIWTGTKLGRGYGSVRPRKGAHLTGAHRFSWAIHNGKWPDKGLVVMHSCDNPECVNPAHLSVGTQAENIKDCVNKGRHVPFKPKPKTHCPNGHEYTEDNTQIVMSRGLPVRRCRECHRLNCLKWKRKNETKSQ